MCYTKIKNTSLHFVSVRIFIMNCHIKRRRLDPTKVSSTAAMLAILPLTTGWQMCARTLGCTDCTCATPPPQGHKEYNTFK